MKRELLRRVRMCKGLNQADLAQLANVYAPRICRIESGKCEPFRPEAQRIATALNWTGTVEDLFRVDATEKEIQEALKEAISETAA